MTSVPLTYAGLSYMDRTFALERGSVSPEGIDLNFVSFESPADLFRRQSQFAEFEASEMSLSTFIMLVGQGDTRFVGLPVFPSRQFRHKDIYVNSRAGIDSPHDLTGREVGVLQYQMTAALWIRAILKHEYGVSTESIYWRTGGLTNVEYAERLPPNLPVNVRLSLIPEDRTLEGMLESGEISALVTTKPPEAFVSGSTNIRRLFPDYRRVEREYYDRTRFFPIMHLVVLRRDVYEAHRWMPVNLVEAFVEAKRAGLQHLRRLTALAVGLPWLASDLEEVDEVFDGDAFPYDLDANRSILEAMTSYSFEQGLAPREVGVEELFAPETLDKRIVR